MTGPGSPSETAPAGPDARRDRSSRLLALSGGLWLGGAGVLYFVGPGYIRSSLAVPDVAMIVFALLGAALLLVAALRPSGPYSPRRVAKLDVHPRHGRERAAFALLVASVALLVAVVLLGYGLVPGMYLPSSGSLRTAVAGCGDRTSVVDPLAKFPNAFPPGALVNLRWATVNGTRADVNATQRPVNGGAPVWTAAEQGSSGEMSFVGSGGAMSFVADAPPSGCAHLQSVEIDWTYSAHL